MSKSIVEEVDDLRLASQMVRLGARLQVMRAETSLSYDRLSALYKEIRGKSSPKGMLPFSADWYVTWQSNIHSTMFYGIYQFLERHTSSAPTGREGPDRHRLRLLIQAYQLYLEQVCAQARGHALTQDPLDDGTPDDDAPVLSFTRAWMLLRFIQSDVLRQTECTQCHGHFVIRTGDLEKDYVCAICKPPPRAGRSLKTGRKKSASAAGTGLASAFGHALGCAHAPSPV